MKVELFKSKDGWRWRLLGGNGEILASSEAYFNRSNARRAAKVLTRLLKVGLFG